MSNFKLIMAVSADGFVARGPADDMRWTGFTDKQVFKLLTLSSPTLLLGRKTFDLMPKLPGRRMMALSRDPSLGMSLEDAAHHFPDAWLGGGAEIAQAALKDGLVESAFICHCQAVLGSGIPFKPIRDLLSINPTHSIVMDMTSSVEVFKRGS